MKKVWLPLVLKEQFRARFDGLYEVSNSGQIRKILNPSILGNFSNKEVVEDLINATMKLNKSMPDNDLIFEMNKIVMFSGNKPLINRIKLITSLKWELDNAINGIINTNTSNVEYDGEFGSKIITTFRNKQTGKTIVNLFDHDGKCLQPNVDQLVLAAFDQNFTWGQKIKHLNGDLQNCYLWNLQVSDNVEYSVVDSRGNTYESEAHASRSCGVKIPDITRNCKGLITHTIGAADEKFIFSYKEEEIWLPNPYSPTTEVSTIGRVKDAVEDKLILDMPAENIAQLVCETFIAEYPEQDNITYVPKFGHLGDKVCSINNLRWGRK